MVAQFLKNGANDFLRKPYSREEFFCRVSQNVDQLELIGSLQDLATRDFLTGLPNRRHFLEQAERLVPKMRISGEPLALAMLDIDHFKHINDCWGHETGDHALRAVARPYPAMPAATIRSRASAARNSACWSPVWTTPAQGSISTACAAASRNCACPCAAANCR